MFSISDLIVTKEKEVKGKVSHHFVAVSFSNNTACDVCHKPMANKASLRCENCLVTVHDSGCKDQINPCSKGRPPKALQRDGSSHGSQSSMQPSQSALLERQSASMTGSHNLRAHSLKDKRSVSAPVKPMPQPISHQLATPSLSHHRHSLPSSSKAISEETESDPATVLETGHSNITETTSESMESLDAVSSMVTTEFSFMEEDPDLQLAVEEPEAWSVTMDEKSLKKLGPKDIKRQDTIWELIQTEKQYVKRLKIMQKIFARTLKNDLHYSDDQMDRLFPRLDDLVALHSNFLLQLYDKQNMSEDRMVDKVGDVLVTQFKDAASEMKSAYGVFCSKHTEAMQLYKEYMKTDRKFQVFAKKCTNLSVCEKRDISDFILGITVRLSKYTILIEAILKSTKDKKDRENLSQALQLSKDVVQYVDAKVATYEKLVDIQIRLESKAVTWRGKKFRRQDLTSDERELVHFGRIGWKSPRRAVEVLALVLSDVIVFLQKNEQKYTYLTQDNKSCVVSLYQLIVREKNDTRDSWGIYLISSNQKTPEMHELVCKNKSEREEWIGRLKAAISACKPPQEEEALPALTGIQEAQTQRRHIIIKLQEQDKVIKDCCDQKNALMMDLLALSNSLDTGGMRQDPEKVASGNESVEVIQAAMVEASRLTTILQGSGTQLSRSVSSVGEHVSHSYVATPVPKRAETFAGFDSNHESPKVELSGMKHRYSLADSEEDEGRSASDVSLDQPEMNTSLTEVSEASLPPTGQPVPNTLEPKLLHAKQLSLPHNQSWEESSGLMEPASDQGSLLELPTPSLPTVMPSNSNFEHMTCIYHLVQHLNTLMRLTSKQSTTVESLRAELAEAKDNMHVRRPVVHRHDQLEELRNIQESISRDRQEWEMTKHQNLMQLEKERCKLRKEREDFEHEKVELQRRKEDLKREREVLQKQIDMRGELGGHHDSVSLMSQSTDSPLGDNHALSQSPKAPSSHRRSASADFYNTVAVSEVENMQNYPPSDPPGRTALPRHTRLSIGSAQPPAGVSALKQSLPMHLLSARNEQRIGGTNLQRFPLKLSGASALPQQHQQQHGGMAHSFPSRAAGGATAISRVQSMSVSSRPALAHLGPQQGNVSSSSLAGIMKLADRKGKPPSSSAPNLIPSHKPPAPQPNAAPQFTKPAAEATSPETNEVIYF